MRLIDADALLEKCNKDRTSLKFAALTLILHYAPTIDAEPVKHGKWEKDYRKTANGVDFPVLSCSECDNADPQMNYYNFCPHCGAKMDKGGDTE